MKIFYRAHKSCLNFSTWLHLIKIVRGNLILKHLTLPSPREEDEVRYA